MTGDLIFGMTFEQITSLQQRRGARPTINLLSSGDHGADPIGDGTFRMVPSGDIVDTEERNRRLAAIVIGEEQKGGST